jgi:hypothetical protein
MERHWCWRCRIVAPMFDEAEFAVLEQLYSDCMRATKEFRQANQLPLEQCSIKERFMPLVEKHFQMTGVREENANAIFHHRRSLYGPPCRRCGKLLRTPQGTKCFQCGETIRD